MTTSSTSSSDLLAAFPCAASSASEQAKSLEFSSATEDEQHAQLDVRGRVITTSGTTNRLPAMASPRNASGLRALSEGSARSGSYGPLTSHSKRGGSPLTSRPPSPRTTSVPRKAMELADGAADDEMAKKKLAAASQPSLSSTSSWTQVATGSGPQGAGGSITGAPVSPPMLSQRWEGSAGTGVIPQFYVS